MIIMYLYTSIRGAFQKRYHSSQGKHGINIGIPWMKQETGNVIFLPERLMAE
jgi:hypothetical protein